MQCKRLFGIITITFAMAAAGCGEPEAARPNDAPIKEAQGATKKGKATKTVDISLELPPSQQMPAKK